jgi:hypothetical protein
MIPILLVGALAAADCLCTTSKDPKTDLLALLGEATSPEVYAFNFVSALDLIKSADRKLQLELLTMARSLASALPSYARRELERDILLATLRVDTLEATDLLRQLLLNARDGRGSLAELEYPLATVVRALLTRQQLDDATALIELATDGKHMPVSAIVSLYNALPADDPRRPLWVSRIAAYPRGITNFLGGTRETLPIADRRKLLELLATRAAQDPLDDSLTFTLFFEGASVAVSSVDRIDLLSLLSDYSRYAPEALSSAAAKAPELSRAIATLNKLVDGKWSDLKLQGSGSTPRGMESLISTSTTTPEPPTIESVLEKFKKESHDKTGNGAILPFWPSVNAAMSIAYQKGGATGCAGQSWLSTISDANLRSIMRVELLRGACKLPHTPRMSMSMGKK